MSIVVSVKVYDGVVLGADSQAQIHASDPQGNVGVAKVYSNARKLFQLGKLRIGVGTYGTGNLGKRSIENLLLEFNESIAQQANLPVQDAAKRLLDFLRERFDAEFGTDPAKPKPILGVLVAGYTGAKPTAEEWEFQIPQDTSPRPVRPVDQFGASWRGISLPFMRLYRGLDPNLVEKLRQLGVADAILSQVKDGITMPVIFDNMPLQDAVDFAEFVLYVTINAARFEIGPASCGGPVDLAVIKPDLGFRWIKQKPLETLMIGTQGGG